MNVAPAPRVAANIMKKLLFILLVLAGFAAFAPNADARHYSRGCYSRSYYYSDYDYDYAPRYRCYRPVRHYYYSGPRYYHRRHRDYCDRPYRYYSSRPRFFFSVGF